MEFKLGFNLEKGLAQIDEVSRGVVKIATELDNVGKISTKAGAKLKSDWQASADQLRSMSTNVNLVAKAIAQSEKEQTKMLLVTGQLGGTLRDSLLKGADAQRKYNAELKASIGLHNDLKDATTRLRNLTSGGLEAQIVKAKEAVKWVEKELRMQTALVGELKYKKAVLNELQSVQARDLASVNQRIKQQKQLNQAIAEQGATQAKYARQGVSDNWKNEVDQRKKLMTQLRADIEERSRLTQQSNAAQSGYAAQAAASENAARTKLMAQLRSDIEERSRLAQQMASAQVGYAKQAVAEEVTARTKLLAQLRTDIEERNRLAQQMATAQVGYAKQAVAEENSARTKLMAQLRADIEERSRLAQQMAQAQVGYAKQAVTEETAARTKLMAQLRADIAERSKLAQQMAQAQAGYAKQAAQEEITARKKLLAQLRADITERNRLTQASNASEMALNSQRARALREMAVTGQKAAFGIKLLTAAEAKLATVQQAAGLSADKHNAELLRQAGFLDRTALAAHRSAGALGKLRLSQMLATQSAAGMRAGMNAVGTHMGIFTGSTILTAAAIYGTISAYKSMVTVGIEFTDSMARANAVMAASPAQAMLLEDTVRNLGETTKFTSVEVAEGLVFLGMAGQTTQQAVQSLKPALQLASIGMIDMGRSADIVTNIMAAFNIDAGKVKGVVDDMATAAVSSNMNIEQLGNSLSYVGPIAHEAGLSLQETVASLEILHNNGIKSSRAGTGLRRMLLSLISPSEKAAKVMAEHGVRIADANGKMMEYGAIMKSMAAAELSLADIRDIVGVRAAAATAKLVEGAKEGVGTLEELTQALYGNANAADILQTKLENTLGSDVKKLLSAIQDKFIEIFKTNEQYLRGLVQGWTDFVRALDTEQLWGFVTQLEKMADVIWKIVQGLAMFAAFKAGAAAGGAIGGVVGSAVPIAGTTIGAVTGSAIGGVTAASAMYYATERMGDSVSGGINSAFTPKATVSETPEQVLTAKISELRDQATEAVRLRDQLFEAINSFETNPQWAAVTTEGKQLALAGMREEFAKAVVEGARLVEVEHQLTSEYQKLTSAAKEGPLGQKFVPPAVTESMAEILQSVVDYRAQLAATVTDEQKLADVRSKIKATESTLNAATASNIGLVHRKELLKLLDKEAKLKIKIDKADTAAALKTANAEKRRVAKAVKAEKTLSDARIKAQDRITKKYDRQYDALFKQHEQVRLINEAYERGEYLSDDNAKLQAKLGMLTQELYLLEEKETLLALSLDVYDSKTDAEYKATQRSISSLEEYIALVKLGKAELSDQAKLIQEYASSIQGFYSGVAGGITDLMATGFENFKGFVDQMKDAFKQMLAEMAYAALVRPILVNMVLGTTGAMGSSVAAAGQQAMSGMGGGGGGLVSSAAMSAGNWLAGQQNPMFNSAFMAANPELGMASGMGSGNALSIGAGGNLAQSVSSLAPAMSALAGALYGYSQSGIKGGVAGAAGGYFGAKGGAALGAMVAGPIGAAVGAVLGGLLGGKVGGSLVGGSYQTKMSGADIGISGTNVSTDSFLFREQTRKRGFGRGSRSRTIDDGMSLAVYDALSDTLAGVRDSLTDWGDVLGTDLVGRIEGYKATYRGSVQNLESWMTGVTEELLTRALPSLTSLRREGEEFEALVSRILQTSLGIKSLQTQIDLTVDRLNSNPLLPYAAAYADSLAAMSASILDAQAQLEVTTDVTDRLTIEQQIYDLAGKRLETELQMFSEISNTIANASGGIAQLRGSIAGSMGGPVGPRAPSAIRDGVTDALSNLTLPSQPGTDALNAGTATALGQLSRANTASAALESYQRAKDFLAREKIEMANLLKTGTDQVALGQVWVRQGGDADHMGWSTERGDRSRTSQFKQDLNAQNISLGVAMALELTKRQQLQSANTATGGITAADARDNLASAELAYQTSIAGWLDSLSEYANGASIATEQLTKLKDETLAWYEAQKQLEGTMLSAADSLRDKLTGMTRGNGTPADSLAAMQAEFSSKLAAAQGMTGLELANASTSISALADQLLAQAGSLYASGSGYQSVFDQVTTALSGLETLLRNEAPKNYEEETLTTLSAIDAALLGLSDNLLSADQSVIEAINNSKSETVAVLLEIRDRIGANLGTVVDGSYASGLGYVPYDGLIAEVHQGEAILTSNEASVWRAGGSKGGGGNDSAATSMLVEEVRRLGQIVEAQTQQLSSIGAAQLDEQKKQTRVIKTKGSQATGVLA